jgi:NAD(P)-dependent dehydrogenase (short-subunit alcohol dehydrogenase family)
MQSYQPNHDLLKDRVILVTGAGEGIGRTAAITFAQYGAQVILLGRTIKKLEHVYDEIENNDGAEPAIYPLNLEGATHKDYQDLARLVETEYGRLDGLLHNAAHFGALTPIEHYAVPEWYKTLQVNLNAPFMLTQATLGLLKASTDASVIFTSANVGRLGKAYWGAYGVSKFAVEGLVQTLADELEVNTRIRVNSLNPVVAPTQLRRTAYPLENPSVHPPIESLMPWYLYLMGPDSSHVTGQAMSVHLPQTTPVEEPA